MVNSYLYLTKKNKNIGLSTDHFIGSLLLIILMTFVISCCWMIYTQQQFSHLATSFLQGDLFFIDNPDLVDIINYGGHRYWALGPMPAILLIPFVAIARYFGFFFYQAYLQIILTIAILFLVYRISKHLKFKTSDALYLAFAFAGASAMLDVILIPFSWYFAHVVTVFFMLTAIAEHYRLRRPLVIGFMLAAVTMTRITAGLGIIFFILFELTSTCTLRERLIRTAKLITPVAGAIIILLLYNFARFGSIFESGYMLQNLRGPLNSARDYGLLGLIHVPGNLYYLFLGHPLPVFRDGLSHVLKPPYIIPDTWGLSLFISSPYYLLLFQSTPKTREEKLLWLTVMSIATPVLLYYGIGYIQIGYRYSLDFLPFLFILLLIHIQTTTSKLSNRLKILFVLIFFSNLYLTLAFRLSPSFWMKILPQ